MTHSLYRSPLKYPGGKIKVLPRIINMLPKDMPLLVDCCTGSGVVFLNVPAIKTIAVDINPDLINFFNMVKLHGERFIADAKTLFVEQNNTSDAYYELRETFNLSADNYERALLLLYLQRHCYNGLFRVNQSGCYNVPKGRYLEVYYPEQELLFLAERSQTVEFVHADFSTAFEMAAKADVTGSCYIDPPYISLSSTANFTSYTKDGFSYADHERLVKCIEDSSKQGVLNLISNHHNAVTKKLYKNASKVSVFDVSRTISQKITARKPVKEVLALYRPINTCG